jgi:hypothetical protein
MSTALDFCFIPSPQIIALSSYLTGLLASFDQVNTLGHNAIVENLKVVAGTASPVHVQISISGAHEKQTKLGILLVTVMRVQLEIEFNRKNNVDKDPNTGSKQMVAVGGRLPRSPPHRLADR